MRKKLIIVLTYSLFLFGCSSNNGVDKKVYKKSEEYLTIMNTAHNGDRDDFESLKYEIFDFIDENLDNKDKKTEEFMSRFFLLFEYVSSDKNGNEKMPEKFEEELVKFKNEYGIKAD